MWRCATPSLSRGVGYALVTFTSLSLSKHTGGEGLPLPPSPAGLFIHSSHGDLPSPMIRSSGHPILFPKCLFFQLLVYYSDCFFALFSLGGGHSVQSDMLIYHVLLSSPGGLCLLKQSGSWHLAVWEPSWFLCLMWNRNAMHGLGVWKNQSLASSWWFFLPGISPASLPDFTLGNMLSASSL
jgi:hypothetical protein